MTAGAIGKAGSRTMPDWVRRRGWTLGVWLLLLLMLAWYAVLIPKFGGFQIAGLGADAREQDRLLRAARTDGRELGGVGGADDQADARRVALVPGGGPCR